MLFFQGGWDSRREVLSGQQVGRDPGWGGDVRVASVYMARERLKRASNAVGFGNHSGLPVSGTAHPV